jgi:hypothetical protein
VRWKLDEEQCTFLWSPTDDHGATGYIALRSAAKGHPMQGPATLAKDRHFVQFQKPLPIPARCTVSLLRVHLPLPPPEDHPCHRSSLPVSCTEKRFHHERHRWFSILWGPATNHSEEENHLALLQFADEKPKAGVMKFVRRGGKDVYFTPFSDKDFDPGNGTPTSCFLPHTHADPRMMHARCLVPG